MSAEKESEQKEDEKYESTSGVSSGPDQT